MHDLQFSPEEARDSELGYLFPLHAQKLKRKLQKISEKRRKKK
jgi:hypothetical protein